MDLAPGVQVDHKNRNKLDCQRQNMRVAVGGQNQANRDSYSGHFKGVSKDGGSYRATIGFENKMIHIGSFPTPEDAAMAYDRAALHYFKEFACLNFPDRQASYYPHIPNQARTKGNNQYLGVSFRRNRQRNPWMARITVGYQIKHLGYFPTEEEAARARDATALRLIGPTAKLNFPINI
jgi:hypothetical protein